MAMPTGFALASGIWMCAPDMAGQTEAWDAPGYYFFAVVSVGLIGGMAFTRNGALVSAGATLGQILGFVCILSQTGSGPTWPISTLLLLGFSLITFAWAVVTSHWTKLAFSWFKT